MLPRLNASIEELQSELQSKESEDFIDQAKNFLALAVSVITG